MQIEIWTDWVCPWCYIGKRRFEQALASFEHRDEVKVVHRSFQLDPTLARHQTFERRPLLMRKYGLTQERAQMLEENMVATAAKDGLEYRLEGGVTGNTFDAHQILQLARVRGVQDAVVERLYRAYFTEQRSLFDTESLVQLATEAGLDSDEVRSVLAENRYAEAVSADIDEARELGATGVPLFIIDRRFGVSGAQGPEVFSEMLSRAWTAGSEAATSV